MAEYIAFDKSGEILRTVQLDGRLEQTIKDHDLLGEPVTLRQLCYDIPMEEVVELKLPYFLDEGGESSHLDMDAFEKAALSEYFTLEDEGMTETALEAFLYRCMRKGPKFYATLLEDIAVNLSQYDIAPVILGNADEAEHNE